ncbi:MAG: DUF6777 domain-containing protein, partial [Actinomycetota bacterium]
MRLSRRGLIVLLLVLLLAGGAVYGSVRLLSRGETVLFQEADSPGPDPFTDPAVFISDVEPVTTTTTASTTTTVAASPSPTPSPTTTGPSTSTTTTIVVTPTEPPQEQVVESGKMGECNRETLIELLNESPERKQAFAEVLEIEVDEFEDYIRSLTPAVLSRDTRITNHGFREGESYAYQSILAEGTAVLVDSLGEIVVRCYCGNPLTPPRQIKYTCDGCPPEYQPPPPCEETCYPPPTTTTTTLPPPTSTTTSVESTTTARGATTTRPS